MPKAVEDCVNKMSGTNKRTGKPFTKSEKWAICTAAHNKKTGKAELSLEDISNLVANATYNYATILFKTGKAETMEKAYDLAQISLIKSGYRYEVLELIAGK